MRHQRSLLQGWTVCVLSVYRHSLWNTLTPTPDTNGLYYRVGRHVVSD